MPDRPSSILIVDDEADARRNLTDILDDLGYRTAAAADGESALALVRSQPFDVALLDFKMPGMNGLELFRAIQAESPETVSIVVSAFTDPATRTEALGLGVTDVLRKPVEFPTLLALIERSTNQPLLLVIDDDPDLCQNLWDVLRGHGYRVALAHDARTAGEKLRSREFKLVLIDLRLPDVDGARLARDLHEKYPDARTVLISGYREELDRLVQNALVEGASAICYKPFDVPELLDLLASLTGSPAKPT